MQKATQKNQWLNQTPMPGFLMDLVQCLIPVYLVASKEVFISEKKRWVGMKT